MRFLFIFVKLTIAEILSCFAINFKNIELFCTQFNGERCLLTYSHHFDVFYVAATINFTFSFHAYLTTII
jgi:hypothetical protein